MPDTSILLLLLIATFAAALALGLWRPLTGILAWIALFPLQFDTARHLGFRFAPSDVVLAALLLAALLRKARHHDRRPRTDAVLGAAAALLAWLVLAAARTTVATGSLPHYVLLNKLVGLASLMASYWLLLETLSAAHSPHRALHWYRLTGSVWNAIGLAAYGIWKVGDLLTPFIFYPELEERLRGLLVDPNAYGGYLASVLIVHLCLMVAATHHQNPDPSRRPRLDLTARLDPHTIALANTGLLVLGLLLSQSRSAWLALACGLAVLVLHLNPAERRRLLGPGLVAATVVLALAALPLLTDRLQNWSAIFRTRGIQMRLLLASDALQCFASAPVWGVGLDGYRLLPYGRGYIIHSTYFWLLAETGLIGILLLSHWAWRLARQARRAWRNTGPHQRALGLAGLASLGVWLGLMIGIEALYQRHYWFVAGAVAAAWCTGRGEPTTHNPPSPEPPPPPAPAPPPDR